MVGMPAARLLDLHVCPVVNVLVPHVGGPIVGPCVPNVLIGGLPAARITDKAFCVGPPDMIVKGSATVLISRRNAARMTDLTTHGGVIATGCFTVLIGDLAEGADIGAAGSIDEPPCMKKAAEGVAPFVQV